jgi:signal transduction histidine kinase
LINVLLFSIILLAMIVVLNRGLLRKLWSPFYDTIKKVKQFRLDKDHALDFSDTHILEFQELNQSISELIQNNRKVYLSQKQFIENASHEMQTPLGIIRNKVDTLAELPSLTLEQAGLIDAITEHTDRLARLNKTLLLLSKIENNQFSENESIDLSVMIGACCDDFADLLEFKKLKLTVDKQGNAFVQMNPDLSRVLFSNLIKNAINHNIIDGFIQINIESTKVVIVNSGKELTSSPDALFERFNKKSDSAQSNGLGLSIVKSICSFYDFTVSYTYQTQIHTISIVFKS